MRGLSIILLLSLVALVAASATEDISDAAKGSSPPGETARSRFKLPKLANFEQFKRMFNKVYTFQAENLVRAKLYLGRAFRAFVSALSYKHGRSSSYLAINQMSDWLPEQLRKTIMSSQALKGLESVPVVTVDELISMQRELLPAAQENIAHSRRKRYLDEQDSHMPDLISFTNDDEQQNSIEKTPITWNFLGNPFGSSFLSAYNQQQAPAWQQLPDAVFSDHRDCMVAPKNQYKCGSCWVFATMALYEWAYCKVYGEKKEFSEQYVIDCGTARLQLGGCSGGYAAQMREFIKEYGIELSDRYPYTAEDDQCPYDASTPSANMGYLRFMDDGFVGVSVSWMDEYLKMAPLIIYISVNDKFHEYGGGVDELTDCNMFQVHAMLVVGSGREDGKEYWLIRNSFGQTWGQAGNYKLIKDSKCIRNNSAYALVRPIPFKDINPLYEGDLIVQRRVDIARANLARSGVLSPTTI